MGKCLAGPTNGLKPYFETLTVDQGLSQNTVYGIYQDSIGMMWFGTQDGLNRYDGYRFQVFRNMPDDPRTIIGNEIHCLFEDHRGQLWIGTDSGLTVLDLATEEMRHFTQGGKGYAGLSHNSVWAIVQDSQNRIWIGTSGGLDRYDPETGTFAHFRHDPTDAASLSHNQVRALLWEAEETIWVGTAGGLNRLDLSLPEVRFQRFRHNPDDPASLTFDRVWDLHRDGQQRLWVVTGGGLSRLDPNQSGFRHFHHDPADPKSLSSNQPHVMLETRDGTLWFGTTTAGLNRYNPESGHFQRYGNGDAAPGDLRSATIYALFEDRSGILWIGTLGGGLHKFNPATMRFGRTRTRDLAPTAVSPQVWSIQEGKDESLWVGTAAELLRRQPGTGDWDRFAHDPEDETSLTSNIVAALCLDQDGELWVGTTFGLNRFDAGKQSFVRYQADSSVAGRISHNGITCIEKGVAGELWIGTSGGGLNRLNRERTHFTHFKAGSRGAEDRHTVLLSSNVVSSVHVDGRGTLWVGTFKGLNRKDRGQDQFKHYVHDSAKADSLSHDKVQCLHEDPRGTLWVGTSSGLNRYHRDSGSFTRYHTRDGLTNDMINGILSDDLGYLWISTNASLSRFDPVDEAFKHFDMQDGLQSNEFHARATFRGKDGLLYFGGVNGFNAFPPAKIKANQFLPPVLITDFQLFNKSVAVEAADPDALLRQSIHQTDALTLSHKDYVFSFEFAALDFTSPQKNQYAYRLEGLDEDWIYTHAGKRFATYTNLRPGDYVFHVKGSNHDGTWNDQGSSLALEIRPPVWKTWWAYSLYFLGTLSLVLLYIRSHKKKLDHERTVNERLRRLDRLKDRFLANTSHELRTPLNGIVGLSESLLQEASGKLPPQTITNLAMIATSGRKLNLLINDILDFSKMKERALKLHKRAVDLHALVEVVLAHCRYLIGHRKLQLLNEVDRRLPPVHADPNRLEQILYNLVGNGVKFTEAGRVSVQARQENGRIAIEVSDTGIGIHKEDLSRIFEPFRNAEILEDDNYSGTGLGLAVSKDLIALHGGDISVNSEPGQGSTFTFTLPLASAETRSSQELASLPPIIPSHPDELNIQPMGAAQETGIFQILVVDDEPINRQVLHNHLSSQGYRVKQAANGAEALQLLEEALAFDLVLLDIMMPGMSGYAVCQKIREHYALHELPVVFLTAKVQESDLRTAFEYGASDYLIKPVLREELLVRVRTHLQLLDITRTLEGKVAERSKELEELTRLKTKFFTNVSHEIRTPLTLTIGPLQDILSGAHGPLSQPLQQQLEIMLRNARRLLQLINQLLDIAKLEAREMTLDLEQADLISFVRRCVLAFASWADRKHIALGFKTESDQLQLGFDPDKIETVLYNLLANAFKYTSEKGKILVSISEPDEEWVHISVKDTGKGIPRDQLKKIFDRFHQILDDNPTVGSGIGLSMAKELIELHEGEIHAASEYGFGSDFTIRLPKTIPHSFDPQKPGQKEGSSAPRNHWFIEPLDNSGKDTSKAYATAVRQPRDESADVILIVEDYLDLRLHLRGHLEPRYTVVEAENGQLGIQLARDKMPDLIISDVIMPEADGFTLCRTLKEDERTSHIPVILLTAKASEDNKLTGLETGADDYLVKPFDVHELLARVANLIETRKKLRTRFGSRDWTLSPSPTSVPTADEVFINRVTQILEHNIANTNFGVYELADEVGFSRRQFLRKIRALTDMGPADFIRQFRLNRAATLLQQRAGTVAEVAYAVGFKHPAHFTALFREKFLQTPSEYAAEPRKKDAENQPNPFSANDP